MAQITSTSATRQEPSSLRPTCAPTATRRPATWYVFRPSFQRTAHVWPCWPCLTAPLAPVFSVPWRLLTDTSVLCTVTPVFSVPWRFLQTPEFSVLWWLLTDCTVTASYRHHCSLYRDDFLLVQMFSVPWTLLTGTSYILLSYWFKDFNLVSIFFLWKVMKYVLNIESVKLIF